MIRETKNLFQKVLISAVISLALTGMARAEHDPDSLQPPMVTLWQYDWDYGHSDGGMSIATDDHGNAYILNRVYGDHLDNEYDIDFYINKVDRYGNRQWAIRIDMEGEDIPHHIHTEPNGDFYITGSTEAFLAGDGFDGEDVFLFKFAEHGQEYWSQQLGTVKQDVGYGVTSDHLGNVYVVGSTKGDLASSNLGEEDAFVTKYDVNGNYQWTKQFGTRGEDTARAAVVDSLGNVYVTGITYGNLETLERNPEEYDTDGFLYKFNANGTELWSKQIENPNGNCIECGYDLAADESGVYLLGYSSCGLEENSQASTDSFISKYDQGGEVLWTRYTQSHSKDWAYGIEINPEGNLVIAGSTSDLLIFGGTGDANRSPYVMVFDRDGQVVNVTEKRETHGTWVQDVAVSGEIILAAGYSDVWWPFARYYTEADSLLFAVAPADHRCVQLASKGDFNCDGIVGLIDLDILGEHYNWSHTKWGVMQGDANNDSKVDLVDLDTVGQYYGQRFAVPEPNTLVMLAAACLLCRRFVY